MPLVRERDAVEDRAVADLAPGDQPRDARPRRVARDQVDLGEQRRPAGRGELAALEGRQRVLVGHRRQAEVGAAVADVAAVVDRVVAVEALARRPRPVVGRHRADRPPAGALERAREREAAVVDELVVAPLAGDLDARLHGGVGQPAQAAERRRGEEGAARRRSRRRAAARALVEHARRCAARTTSPGPRSSRSSRRTRAGRPCPAGRSRSWLPGVSRKRSWASWRASTARSCRSACTDCTSSTASAAALEEATGAPATRRITHSDAEHRRRPERPAAVAGRDARHAQQRQHRDREERERRARPRRRRRGPRSTCRSRRAASRRRSPRSSSRRPA